MAPAGAPRRRWRLGTRGAGDARGPAQGCEFIRPKSDGRGGRRGARWWGAVRDAGGKNKSAWIESPYRAWRTCPGMVSLPWYVPRRTGVAREVMYDDVRHGSRARRGVGSGGRAAGEERQVTKY